MATFQIETPHGTLEIEHDGDASSLTPAVHDWVQGQSNLKATDEYLAASTTASTTAPNESLSEFITPAQPADGPNIEGAGYVEKPLQFTAQKTALGELSKGNIPGAVSTAAGAVRESLSPILGPTEEQISAESVPWGTNPDGSVKYEYKPMADLVTRKGIFATPEMFDLAPIPPDPNDPAWKAALKAGTNQAAAFAKFGMSPGGILMTGMGGAGALANTAKGLAPAGLGAESAGAAQIASTLAKTGKGAAGFFAVDMAAAAPEQFEQAFNAPTLQGKIEGWIGGVSSLGFAALATKHATGQSLTPAESRKVESVAEMAKGAPDALLETVAQPRNNFDVYSQTIAQNELLRRFKERQAELAPEAAAAAEVTASALPNGRLVPPDPEVTAAGAVKTAEAAAAAGRPFAPIVQGPITEAQYGRTLDVFDVAAGLERKPISPAPEPVTPAPAAVSADTAPPPAAKVAGETIATKAPDVFNPDNLSAREWIEKRVKEGATREEAIAERDKANDAANAWFDSLPTGTVVRAKNGMEFVKESDGTLRNTNGSGSVNAGSAKGMEIVSRPETKPAAKVAGEPLPEPTRTEPSPVATPAAAVPKVAAPAAPEPAPVADIKVGDTITAKSHQITGLTHTGKVVSIQGNEIGMVNQDNAPVLVLKKNVENTEPAPAPAVGLPKGFVSVGASTGADIASPKKLGGYNADVEAAQIRRGQVPTVSEARKEDPVTFDAAMDAIEKNPALPEKLVDDILKKEKKSITDEEQQMLTYRRAELENKMAAESERAIDPSLTPEEQAVHQTNAEVFEAQLLRAEEANRMAGTASGRSLRSRQMEMNDDYTFAGMMMRERKRLGDVVPKERAAEIKREADAIKKKQQEIDAGVEETQKQELENAVDSVLAAAIADREAQKSAAQRSGDLPYHPSILARAEEIVKGIEAKRDELRAKVDWRKLFGSQSGAVGGVGGGKGEGKPMGGKSRAQETREARAAAVEYLAYEIAAHISRFGVNRAKTLEVMLTKFDESIRPFYGKAWDAAQKIVGGKTKSEKPKVAKAVKTGATAPEKQPKPPKPPKSKDTLVGEGRAAIEATGKLSHNVVAQIVDGMIDAGNRDRADIFNRTTKIVQEFMPEAEMRDVYRAYVDYGKKTYPNPDEAAAFKRKTRQAVKIEEDIARLKEKMRPELQGYQREKMDLELRDLVKRRSELLKDPSLPQEPGAFASKDEAKQTRIKNRIEELDRYLKTGEKPVEGKPTQPDSAATEQLRAEKEALEAYVREVDAAKNPPPPEHVAELARLQDRADILRDRLARMELTQPKAEGKPTVDTAEIAAAKAEIKQLSETIAELRKPIPLSDAQKALDSALVARERAGQTLDDLSTGKVKDPVKIKEALTQLEEDVRLETDALKALAAEMRRDAKPKGDPGYLKEQAQIKALERAIASYADKVAKSDLAGKGKVMGPDSRRVAQLKAIRDSRRAAYKAAKDAGKPVRSPEDRYNDTRLNAMKRREADLKARAARQAAGDFSKKPKPVTPALRRDVLAKKAELQKMKDEIDLRQKEYELSQQPAWQKALRGLGEARGIVLGGDLGVLTRQGAFAWSRPINATIGAIKATQAMFSPEAMGRWEVEMRERVIDGKPVAPIRKEAGLQTTDTMSHPEELVITRLLSRMPDIKIGGKTIKASVFFKGLERFQTTFINDVRMRTFDAAVKRGFTPEELKLRANFINSATGRSNAKMVGPWLSAIFTSPRYERSRWEMLAQPVRNIGALARSGVKGELNRAALANLKDMAVTAAGAYVLFQLAESAGGYTVNWDPTSTDFLKMRKGDEVWDVTAGLAPRIRDLMRLWVGANHPDYNENWMKTGAKMFVRTINPALKTPAEQFFIAKQRLEGVEKPKSPFTGFKSEEEREGLITLAPLIVQSMRQAMKEDGVDAAVWAGAREFVGSSVSRYPEPKK